MRPYRIVLVSVLFAAGFHSSCSREGGVSTAGIRRLAEGLSREFVERKGLGCQALQELDRYSQCLPNVPGKMYDYGNHVATIVIKDGWIVEEWVQPAGIDVLSAVSGLERQVFLALRRIKWV